MEYKAEINDKGEVLINNVAINEEIFNEEKVDYTLREREEQIDSLIDWISESTRDSDKILMKADLKYLMKLTDAYIFSSISTNEYIAYSDNSCKWDNLCEEILKLNEVEK